MQHRVPSNPCFVGVAVGSLVGQHVPHDPKELTGDSDNGLLLADANGQVVEFSLPVRVAPHGSPGGFDHRCP